MEFKILTEVGVLPGSEIINLAAIFFDFNPPVITVPVYNTISVSPPLEASIEGDTIICDGESTTLIASSGTSYFWSTGEATRSITVGTQDIYTVTVFYENSCESSAGVSVTVNPSPEPTIVAAGPTTFCDGNSVLLDAGIHSSYLWLGGDTTQTITVTQPGNNIVTVTDTVGCSGTSALLTVTVNLPPINDDCSGATVISAGTFAGTTESLNPVCTGSDVAPFCGIGDEQSAGVWYKYVGTGNYVNASLCSGTFFDSRIRIYSGSCGNLICETGNDNFCGTQAEVFWCSVPGTDYLILVYGSGNSEGSFTLTITETSADVTVTVDGPTTFCQGNSVTLNAGSFSGYLWSTGETTQTLSVTQSGSFDVTVTDTNGCIGTSQTITVTVNPLPTPVISADGPTTFCQGNSVNLDAGSFSSFQWSTGETTQTISVTQSGSFDVTVTDVNGCIGTSQAITATAILPIPVISADGPTSFCQGNSVNLNAGSFSSYQWSTGETTQTISVTQSGSFDVTVTDDNGCEGTDTITVVAIPTPIVDLGPDQRIIRTQNILLDPAITNGSPPYTYLWNTGQTNPSIVVSPSGFFALFSVTVAANNGCTGSDDIRIFIENCDRLSCAKNKVLICHFPPGNFSNPVEMCISANALPAHLAAHPNQGFFRDHCGPCLQINMKMSGEEQSDSVLTDAHFEEDDITESGYEEVLLQSYPNPLSDMTTISFRLTKGEDIRLTVHTLSGEHVKTLYDDYSRGNLMYDIEFDANNLAGGVYFYRLTTKSAVYNRKLVIVRR